MNLTTPIIDRFATDPSRPCISITDASGRLTARYDRVALLERAGGWAARLRMEGVVPGDRVALFLARDLDLAAVHLACIAAGLTVVPINTALADDELDALLGAAQPRLVIADAALALRRERSARLSATGWWLAGAADAIDLPAPFEVVGTLPRAALSPCPTTADATALLLFTSGTTGRPKSVPLSHANLCANLDALAAVWQRDERDRLLHVLPAHHFHGLVLALYGSLSAGNEIVLMPGFDARATLATIAASEISLLMAVPTMYARMLAVAEPNDDLSPLRLAISGSAPLSPATWRAFRDRFAIEIVERYGLTETGIIASNPAGRARPGSVGLPLPGVELRLRRAQERQSDLDKRVAGADDRESVVGRAGDETTAAARAVEDAAEICVRGPSVMAGYGNDPEANRTALRDGWFHTGDLGRIDDDGYLWIVGRAKELIIVGGSNVVPGEVERALDGVTGVRELAVAGLVDADLGEVVAAFVVCDGPRERARAALELAARKGLAPYKRPRRYVFVETLPRNAMGKIDRARLSRLTNGAA